MTQVEKNGKVWMKKTRNMTASIAALETSENKPVKPAETLPFALLFIVLIKEIPPIGEEGEKSEKCIGKLAKKTSQVNL